MQSWQWRLVKHECCLNWFFPRKERQGIMYNDAKILSEILQGATITKIEVNKPYSYINGLTIQLDNGKTVYIQDTGCGCCGTMEIEVEDSVPGK